MQKLEDISVKGDGGIPAEPATIHRLRSDETESRVAAQMMTELAASLADRSAVPLYRQVSSQIAAWIEEGRLQPGDQLVSERKMTELLQVSRRTVRAALADLIARNYVSATHGRGNFVLEPPKRREMRFLALERFAPEPSGASGWHYDLIHDAELRNNVAVHYKYAPSPGKLHDILSNPPSGYQGILIVRPSEDWLESMLQLGKNFLRTLSIPLLIVNRDVAGSGLNFVSADHFRCAHVATRRLVDLGHSRIGFISSSLSLSYMRRTFEGYSAAMGEAGLPIRPEFLLHCDTFRPEIFEKEIHGFLHRKAVSAVVVAGTVAVSPFEKAIQRTATVVPEELSAVLISERYILDRLTLRWSSVVYPDDEVFHRSLQVLGELSWHHLTPPVEVLLPPKFQAGATCSAAHQN
jgi:GntR family transcriptional regulator of arabinose operon